MAMAISRNVLRRGLGLTGPQVISFPVKTSRYPLRTPNGAHRNQPRSCPRVQGCGELLSMARQAPRQGSRNLDQDPQGGFRTEIDHAEGSDRRRPLLGVDRWPSQRLRRKELSAALHAAYQEKRLEPDQR